MTETLERRFRALKNDVNDFKNSFLPQLKLFLKPQQLPELQQPPGTHRTRSSSRNANATQNQADDSAEIFLTRFSNSFDQFEQRLADLEQDIEEAKTRAGSQTIGPDPVGETGDGAGDRRVPQLHGVTEPNDDEADSTNCPGAGTFQRRPTPETLHDLLGSRYESELAQFGVDGIESIDSSDDADASGEEDIESAESGAKTRQKKSTTTNSQDKVSASASFTTSQKPTRSRKRSRDSTANSGHRAKRPTRDPELDKERKKILQIDPRCQIPDITGVLPDVLRLAASVTSLAGVEQFIRLVKETRTKGASTGSSDDRVTRICQELKQLDNKSELTRYLTRRAQLRLVQAIEEARDGRAHSTSAAINELCSRTGLSRERYDYHRREGRRWQLLCGENPGLLCFIPLKRGQNPLFMKCNLNEGALRFVQQAWDTTSVKTLCEAGNAFHKHFDTSLADVRFGFEDAECTNDVTLEIALGGGIAPAYVDVN